MDMCPKHAGWPLPYTRTVGEGPTENGRAMGARFLSLCHSSTDIRSEQIAYLCIGRHACRCDYADDVGNWISRNIIGIQGERSRIVFPVRTERNLFNYLNRA